MIYKIKQKTYYEPVKHREGKMCSFSDVSITPEGLVCRNCGGVDYTVDCVVCNNAFSSSEIYCPHCFVRTLGSKGGKKSVKNRFKGMSKEQRSEMMRRVRLPGKKEQENIDTAQKKVIGEI